MHTREFHYHAGTSSKFWRIGYAGCSCTVQFGKIGGAGQTQTKTYADAAAAQAAYTKQIAEKVKKGYREVTANTAASDSVTPVTTPVVSAPTPRSAPAAAAPEVSPPTPMVFDTTPSLNLDPHDWFWATWRNSQPLERPAAAPFDKADALLRLALCSPEEIVTQLLEQCFDPQQQHYTPRNATQELLAGFRRYVLPYLSQTERERLSQLLTPHLDPTQWSGNNYHAGPPAFYLAAMLGGHNAVLRQLVESWPDDHYSQSWSDYYQQPQVIIFGLNDPLLVERQMRRLQLSLRKPDYIRAWLAHTACSALDVVCSSIQHETSRDTAIPLAQTLALAVAPEVAPCMLALQQSSKAPQIARAWLDEHPAHAIAGLLPLADGRGAQAEAAIELLGRMARRGYVGLIDEALVALPEDVAARLRGTVIDSAQPAYPTFDEQTTPGWLREALQAQPSLASAKLPGWAQAADLPPVIVEQHTLSTAQIDLLLRALRRSKLDTPHPLIVALKQHADQVALDTFAWSLFEMWLADGAPAKENWAMLALGWLGGDALALKLAPLIRVWPGESQHQRAVNGLECLRAIGSDTALMQINGIAQKVKFKGLQQRAAECMERIATERGLSRAQLEDRIVPDCDLDARGERIFDFGPRQFRFVLGPEMKPMVRDPQGKLRPNLPAPNAKDDADQAARACADWKLLKKQVSEVAGVQAVRLEQAMVTGCRWSRDEFETLLVRHPLMTHLVRTLVWGAYDAAGALSGTFRVTEDQTYADRADDTFALAPDASVGIVHPLHLAADERAAWGELLSDYEIVQPFPQLGRPIQRLEEQELPKTEITRFNDLTISAPALVFGLDKLGWVRDSPADAGCFCGHSKPFYQANVTAVVQYQEGVAVSWIVDAPDQQIQYVAFVPGIQPPSWWPTHGDRLPLSTIDPVVISEVLNDMLTLAAKAK